MSKIIAISNQKGGVAKTTTAVNLSASLAAAKVKILLIDIDPQGNASVGSGIEKNGLEETIHEVLTEELPLEKAIVPTVGGYDLLPANGNLVAAEVLLMQQKEPPPQTILRDKLASIRDKYEYILIDCPPSLNILTLNSLIAADSVLIPIQCEYYALEGLSDLLRNIKKIQQSANPDLVIEGVLRTLHDGRTSLSRDVSQQLHEHFGDKLFNTIIRRNVRLAEAPSHGLPIMSYDRSSSGAKNYYALAGEILRRHGKA